MLLLPVLLFIQKVIQERCNTNAQNEYNNQNEI